MRLSKSIILAAIGLILTPVIAGAQNRPMPQERPMQQRPMQYTASDSIQIDRHVNMLRDSLYLTDTQTEQVRTILMAEHQQLVADRETYGNDAKAFDKARNNLIKDTNKQIKDVLNKDQQKKYDQIEKQMKKTSRGYRYQDHQTRRYHNDDSRTR